MKNLPSDDGRQVSNLQDIYFKKQSHGYNKTTEERRDAQRTHTESFYLMCSKVRLKGSNHGQHSRGTACQEVGTEDLGDTRSFCTGVV